MAYTLARQNRTTGGWRYHPHDVGDTSQLGWQLMVLKSAELGGLRIPDVHRELIVRFLATVTSGTNGGLASYRPGEPISRTMTAEALVCRQFLGLGRRKAAGEEAAAYLLEELPGVSQTNHYYWYYATLSLYQVQGTAWQRWNEALTGQLIATQHRDGNLAGTWDPDAVWGGYGGRVYSTALTRLVSRGLLSLPAAVHRSGCPRRPNEVAISPTSLESSRRGGRVHFSQRPMTGRSGVIAEK